MVTGKIELHLIGQHDQSTHGTGSGGSVGGASDFPPGDWKGGPTDRKVTVQKPNPGEETLEKDGYRLKGYYETTTKDGTKLKIYDLAGDHPKGMSLDSKQEALRTMADLHDQHPLNPPRNIVIMSGSQIKKKTGSSDYEAYVEIKNQGTFFKPKWAEKNPNIVLNNDGDILSSGSTKGYPKNWFMDSVTQTPHKTQYIVSHEYGHMYDLNKGRGQGAALFKNRQVNKSLSKYGQFINAEGYAEAFADWHVTKGQTNNFASNAYARHEGWTGSNGPLNNVIASGRLSTMVFQNNDSEDLSDQFGSPDSIIIADSFSDKVEPKIIYSDGKVSPVVEPTAKEQEKVDEFVEELIEEIDKSKLSTTGRVELSNQCHGTSDGKFCETPGPGASGGDWPDQRGREVKVVGENITVDGVPSKKVYEVETSDGTKLRAYIIAGDDHPQAIKETLNSMAVQHEMYPSRPPRRALIVDDATATALEGPDGPHIAAWTYPARGHRHSIFINSDNLYSGRFEKEVAKPELKDWFMPNAQKVNPSHYLITHEAGHQYDFMAGRNSAKPLFFNNGIKNHLSTYGKTIKEEAYAESFAEWHTSKGKTPNPTARAYAEHEGWFGTDGYRKPSLQGSGFTMEEFQNKESPSDLKGLTPKDGAMIGDTFRVGEKPIVKGNLPDKTVTKASQKNADKLVEDVFRSMGFDSKGDKLKYSTTGTIALSTELHLIGKHDQSSHGRGGGSSHVTEKKFSEVTGKNNQGQSFTKYGQLKTADLSKFTDTQLKTLHRQSDLDRSSARSLKNFGAVTGAIGASWTAVSSRSKNPNADPGAGIVIAATGAVLSGIGALRERQVSKQQTRIVGELENRGISTNLSIRLETVNLQDNTAKKDFVKKNVTEDDITMVKNLLLNLKEESDSELPKDDINKALKGLKTIGELLPLRDKSASSELKQRAVELGIIRE